MPREKSIAFELFGAGWRSRWDTAGLAFRAEAGDGFPHSGREAASSPARLPLAHVRIDKPYLAIRVAGREAAPRHPHRLTTASANVALASAFLQRPVTHGRRHNSESLYASGTTAAFSPIQIRSNSRQSASRSS